MMKRYAPALFIFASLAFGCSVTEVPPPADSIVINECSERSDCGAGRCERGMCVAHTGTTSALFLEVMPPGSSKKIASLPFYARLENLDLRGSALDIHIAPPVRVNVAVSARTASDCTLAFVGKTPGTISLGANNGSIPVEASFEPRERREFPALATTKYAGSVDMTGWESANPGKPEMLSFTILLPLGYYDVYFDPPRAAAGGCEIPPLLLRDQKVPTGDLTDDQTLGDFNLSVELPQPTRLDVIVNWPKGGNSLRGWVLEVLDPLTARLISTQTVLGDPDESGETASYSASVLYTPVHVINAEGRIAPDLALKGHEVVRLSPPVKPDASTSLIEQVATPAILASLNGHVFPGTFVIQQEAVLPAPVIVQSHVNAFGEPRPLAADVTVVGKSIEGIDPGIFASFVRTLQAEEDGQFDLKLLPGKYEVRAVPSDDSARATSVTEWTVSGDKPFQSGRVIELNRAPRFRGTASLPFGGGASGASLHVVPTAPEVLPSTFAMAFGDVPPTLRGAVELLGADGWFDVALDPGVFDVTVRPEARSRFGWYVDSRLELTPDQGDYELPEVAAVPLPIAYRGTVWLGGSDVGTPIGGVLIRAYAYLGSDGNFTSEPLEARSLVQVAEALADNDGRYELLIPARLN